MSTIVRAFFIIMVVIIAGILGIAMFVTHNKYIDLSVLEQYNAGKPSRVLDDEGNEWARFQLDRREPISLGQMPPHLINAFLAAEDWSFFHHAGISWKGIIRSTLVNLYHGRKVQGASTITQQLVRLLFFDAKKTFTRKIKEQIVALLVESQFSKEQILETYLNHVCFGCGIYGVEAACQRFWGKHAGEITIDEAAVLAAIMRSPTRYCPIINPLSAEKRRNVVLNSMHKLGFITADEYTKAKEIRVIVKEQDKGHCAPHLKEMVRLFLEDLVGKTTLYTGGLTIQTTINRAMQDTAQHAFTQQFKQLRSSVLPGVDGALVSLDVKTGEIKAIIGGVDFNTSKFNRAIQAKRQMGSTFKPLVYATALEHGMNFADTAIDEPLELPQTNGVWRPNNAFRHFEGQMTLAWALSSSNNIVAIKTFLAVGAQRVIELAKKCHLQGPFIPYPSLALGCTDATPKDVAAMFNVFANDGVYVEPHYIRWVKDCWGNKIWRNTAVSERVLSSKINGQVAKVLELGLQRIREKMPGPWVNADAISKTGTTNDFRNCWFAGATPDITTVLYLGRDDYQPIQQHIFPVRTVFPIWLELYKTLPVTHKKFNYDPSLADISVDYVTGRHVSAQHPDAITIALPR